MKVDYIVLAVVAVLGIVSGLYLLLEARKYRKQRDLQKKANPGRGGLHES